MANYYEDFNNGKKVKIKKERNNLKEKRENRVLKFIENYYGISLPRLSNPINSAREKFIEKFVVVEEEKPMVREPQIKKDDKKYLIIDKNEALYNEIINTAYRINHVINSNKQIDFSKELDELKSLLIKLTTIYKKNDYKALEEINEKMNNLTLRIANIIFNNIIENEQKEKSQKRDFVSTLMLKFDRRM